MAERMAQKYRACNAPESAPAQTQAPAGPAVQPNTQARTVNTANTLTYSPITTWDSKTGSENVYGMLVSNSKPLNYNDELGAISFIHRKSHTYMAYPQPAPNASTGVISAEITTNWGISWDSTALWANDNFWARYPNGGIYNSSPTNTDVSQAYVVGTGPVTTANDTWQGNWFASKRLDCMGGARYNNTVSAVPGAQQFIANSGTATAGPTGKVDFARLDFAFTDDGNVHALGTIMNNANGTTFATQLTRGARVLKAAFNSGSETFDWSGDSIIPPVITNSDGHAMLLGDPHMAWKEDGSIGYVFFIGCRQLATSANKGNQPIVYKTTDHGATWNILPGIDFNSSAMASVLKNLQPTSAIPSLTIPMFDTQEGIDGMVDANGKLHIMSCVMGSQSPANDSLNGFFQFTNSLDGESYAYPHTPGKRPYIYDFYGDGSAAWNVIRVDSMSSEAPGWFQSSDNGFTNNPWDVDPTTNSKVAIEARLQMSRTPDGKYIIYTWAESDSVTTANGVKWNYNPNIKARLLDVTSMSVHPKELNVTSPPNINDANPAVRGFAYNHYASSKCGLNNGSTTHSLAFFVPMTVSNNSSLHQREPVNHYFSAAVLNFDSIATVFPPYVDACKTTGIESNAMSSSAKNSVIYPNPAKGSASLLINLNDNSGTVNIVITNVVGQQIKTIDAAARTGENTINLDLDGLTRGIYLVNVKVGNAVGTKKLVVD